MVRTKLVVLAAALYAAGALAQGDTLQMGGTDNSASLAAAGTPTRGMTQNSVRAEYGSPQTEEAAVGEPPITRWHYPTFVVYFEYDRVIHAVARR